MIWPPVTPLANKTATVAPGYSVPRFRAARLPQNGRLATWLRSSVVPSVSARTSPLRPSPQTTGPRTCGSAAGYTVPSFTTAGCSVNSATGSVPLFELVTLRCRLRGATSRLGFRPARRVPTLRWVFPPAIVLGFVKGAVLPAQPVSVVGK